jgi:hypothetical protein
LRHASTVRDGPTEADAANSDVPLEIERRDVIDV